jgi:protein-tyrosine phosphatase
MKENSMVHSVLFVCMGNICRSPSAEGFFRAHAEQAGLLDCLRIDSAGTHGYHVGHPPDSRAIAEAAAFNIDISGLRARQVQASDFHEFDHIVAMDTDNLRILQRLLPGGAPARLSLMMAFARDLDESEVPDPYYGNQGDFTYMCQLLDAATRGLLQHIQSQPDGD